MLMAMEHRHAHLAGAPKVYQADRFSVHRVDLPRRSGGAKQREVVLANDAVVILPLIDATPGREEVVLIRNERFALGQTLWEVPAGTIEPGEDPDDCAARELIEETGYRGEIITPLTQFYPTPGFCTELMHVYRAEGLSFVGQDLDETERITAEVVSFEKSMEMVKDGTIRDGKTIATLLYHQTFGRG